VRRSPLSFLIAFLYNASIPFVFLDCFSVLCLDPRPSARYLHQVAMMVVLFAVFLVVLFVATSRPSESVVQTQVHAGKHRDRALGSYVSCQMLSPREEVSLFFLLLVFFLSFLGGEILTESLRTQETVLDRCLCM